MRILFCLSSLLLVYSCSDISKAPKIDYNESGRGDTLTLESLVKDTTKALIAEFPIYFDSTNVLIQPSGLVNITEIRKDKSRSLKGGSFDSPDVFDDYNSVTRLYNDDLSGNMTNLYFDDLATNKQQFLTKQILNISNVSYLRKIGKDTGKHYLLYSVYDRDTNRDGKLDLRDVSSLYISFLDGSGFTKLTKDSHEYSEGRLINIAKRYYFTTIEDINKDGFFNKGDLYHYYYIDFSGESYKVVEYNPLNVVGE